MKTNESKRIAETENEDYKNEQSEKNYAPYEWSVVEPMTAEEQADIEACLNPEDVPIDCDYDESLETESLEIDYDCEESYNIRDCYYPED